MALEKTKYHEYHTKIRNIKENIKKEKQLLKLLSKVVKQLHENPSDAREIKKLTFKLYYTEL